MTGILELFRAHLLADAAIAALVVDRVSPVKLPQGEAYPAITFFRASAPRDTLLSGAASRAMPLFQVDSWAATQDAVTDLGALVRQRLEGFNGNWSDGGSPATSVFVQIEFINERDAFEEDEKDGVWRHSADYRVSHGTAGGTI